MDSSLPILATPPVLHARMGLSEPVNNHGEWPFPKEKKISLWLLTCSWQAPIITSGPGHPQCMHSVTTLCTPVLQAGMAAESGFAGSHNSARSAATWRSSGEWPVTELPCDISTPAQ